MDAATQALLTCLPDTRPMSLGIATNPSTPREAYLQLASNDIDTTTDAWRDGITLLIEVLAQEPESIFMDDEDDAWGSQR